MEIAIVLVLILINSLFAMSETAVVSSRKARLQSWASDGDTRARAALELADHPTHFLSTVQIGITLVGILAGAFGGATIADQLAVYLRRIPLLAPYSGPLSLGVVVLLITYFSLVLGELVPKRLALFNPERVASAVAGPMRTIALVTYPVVRLLTWSTELVLRLLGLRPSNEPPVTEDEINVLIGQGAEAGVFEEAEPELVRGVFRLGDREVGGIMTPRMDIIWLDPDEPAKENQRRIAESSHTRFPVCRGSLDNVVGMAQTKDLLLRSLRGEAFDLEAGLLPPVYVPERASALQLLEQFKRSGIHIALVVDEYGGIQGLATLNDVMEAIVGDLPSADEPADPAVVRREDGSWLLDGMLAVDEIKEILDLRELPNEDRGDYQTLGGFMMMQLGHIPVAGDRFAYGDLTFEVVDMDGRRVDKVMVSPLAGRVEESGD
jgi:putative hemolysin